MLGNDNNSSQICDSFKRQKGSQKKDTERTVTKMETLKQSLSLYEHDAPAILFLLQLFFFRRRRRFLFYWAYNNIIRKNANEKAIESIFHCNLIGFGGIFNTFIEQITKKFD